MALNKRSHLITHGVARSPNRAMLRAVGFGDGDFEKPIIGVANGHSTMNPCNAGIQPLVDRAIQSLHAAGAMPQMFGVPTITDGIGMGTEAMKYSLVSREVIADAIRVRPARRPAPRRARPVSPCGRRGVRLLLAAPRPG